MLVLIFFLLYSSVINCFVVMLFVKKALTLQPFCVTAAFLRFTQL